MSYRTIMNLTGTLLFTTLVLGCNQGDVTDEEASSVKTLAASEGELQPPAPPPEAFQACKSLAEQAACTVQIDDHAIEGSCRRGPDGLGELACVPNDPPPRPHPHRGPPPEAFTACAQLQQDASCSVTLGSNEIEGSCRRGPDGLGELACVPNDPPPRPHPHRGPPPEAFTACAQLQQDASCSVTLGSNEIEGSCRRGPDGLGELACVPNDPPPRPHPHRGPPPEAFTACAELEQDASCSVTLGSNEIEGTCRRGPDGLGELACVPNDPPPRPHPHRGPPPEAFTACAELEQDASCSVTLGSNEIEGTCRRGPDGQSELACVPNDPPPNHPPLR